MQRNKISTSDALMKELMGGFDDVDLGLDPVDEEAKSSTPTTQAREVKDELSKIEKRNFVANQVKLLEQRKEVITLTANILLKKEDAEKLLANLGNTAEQSNLYRIQTILRDGFKSKIITCGQQADFPAIEESYKRFLAEVFSVSQENIAQEIASVQQDAEFSVRAKKMADEQKKNAASIDAEAVTMAYEIVKNSKKQAEDIIAMMDKYDLVAEAVIKETIRKPLIKDIRDQLEILANQVNRFTVSWCAQKATVLIYALHSLACMSKDPIIRATDENKDYLRQRWGISPKAWKQWWYKEPVDVNATAGIVRRVGDFVDRYSPAAKLEDSVLVQMSPR